MTTVDVYIGRADGSDSFSLHNGLFGAATTVLHALISQSQDGAITGPWHRSYVDTTVKGRIVRSRSWAGPPPSARHRPGRCILARRLPARHRQRRP